MTEPVLDIDDLFMTGVLSRKARVRLYDDNRFDQYCGDDYCLMRDLISFHGCQTANQTLRMWNYWRKSDQWECPNSTNDYEFDFPFFGRSWSRLRMDFDNSNFRISF